MTIIPINESPKYVSVPESKLIESNSTSIQRRVSFSKFFEETICLHDPAAGYPGIQIPSAEHYLVRALVMPSDVVFIPESLKEETLDLYEYLINDKNGPKIGPKKIVFIRSNTMKDFFVETLFEIQTNTEFKGKKLSVFKQSLLTQEAFLQIVDLIRDDQVGFKGDLSLLFNLKTEAGLPTLNATEAANNKLLLRLFIERYGGGIYDMFNIDFFIVNNEDSNINKNRFAHVQDKVADRKGLKREEVYLQLKDVNSASGQGQLKCNSWEDAEKFIENFKLKNPTAVFMIEERVEIDNFKEAGLKTEGSEMEGSAQFGVTEEEGGNIRVDFFGLTKQYVINNEHQGNGITYDQNEEHNRIVSSEQISLMTKLIKDLAKTFKYRGYIGLDYAITIEGRLVIFEANARITGGTYPLAVLNQLIENGADENTAVVSRNTIKPKIKFEGVVELNNFLSEQGLLFNPETYVGVIPTLTTDLHNKLGVVVVGRDLKDAENRLIQLRKILDNTYENAS